MKPILIQAEIPPGVTLIVKNSEYNHRKIVYIKGHWFRSWYGYDVDAYNTEDAIKLFVASYYGHIVTTDTNKYPEEFLWN